MMITQRTQRITLLRSVFVMSLAGCGYSEVSPLTYDYAKALYSATNRQDAEQLAFIRVKVDASLEDDQLTDKEARWLVDIIDTATSGDWDEACDLARRMMLDQVKS